MRHAKVVSSILTRTIFLPFWRNRIARPPSKREVVSSILTKGDFLVKIDSGEGSTILCTMGAFFSSDDDTLQEMQLKNNLRKTGMFQCLHEGTTREEYVMPTIQSFSLPLTKTTLAVKTIERTEKTTIVQSDSFFSLGPTKTKKVTEVPKTCIETLYRVVDTPPLLELVQTLSQLLHSEVNVAHRIHTDSTNSTDSAERKRWASRWSSILDTSTSIQVKPVLRIVSNKYYLFFRKIRPSLREEQSQTNLLNENVQ
jgi:hypothetical protein